METFILIAMFVCLAGMAWSLNSILYMTADETLCEGMTALKYLIRPPKWWPGWDAEDTEAVRTMLLFFLLVIAINVPHGIFCAGVLIELYYNLSTLFEPSTISIGTGAYNIVIDTVFIIYNASIFFVSMLVAGSDKQGSFIASIAVFILLALLEVLAVCIFAALGL